MTASLCRPAFVGRKGGGPLLGLLWSSLVIGLAVAPTKDRWSWLIAAGVEVAAVFVIGWMGALAQWRAIRRVRAPTPGVAPPRGRVSGIPAMLALQTAYLGVPVSTALGFQPLAFGAIAALFLGVTAHSIAFGLVVARREKRLGVGLLLTRRRPYQAYGFSLGAGGADDAVERPGTLAAADLVAREPYINSSQDQRNR